MTPARLLELYDRISEAPDAVARLRRFVLDLAVRGMLVAQDPEDEPASELLNAIEGGKLGQANLPKGWRKAYVGTLLNFQYGKGLKASERAKEGPVPVYGSNGIVGFTDEPLTEQASIIVGRKGSAGALNLCPGPSWTTDVAYFVEAPAFLEIQYLLHALSALDLDKLGKGVKPGLSRADAYKQILLVPPLAEQQRIVAKVDELMALCDRLEEERARREALRDRLTTAILGRLSAPDSDPEVFTANSRFALDNLDALTARPDQIKTLRQTILDLAVRGKLVEQDPEDEAASALLEELADDIEAYANTCQLRKSKGRAATIKDEPYPLPRKWSWAHLENLCRVVTDGDHQPPPRSETGVAFLTIGNVTTGKLNFEGCRRVPQSYVDNLPTYRTPEKGDLLYTVVGATFGRPVCVDTDEQFCVQRHIAILKPAKGLCVSYLHYALASPFIYEQATSATTGAAQPTIALKPLRNFLVPLPPLAEQQRIVAKVDELMALCDRLEVSLMAADITRASLLEAVLHGALAPAMEISEAAE